MIKKINYLKVQDEPISPNVNRYCRVTALIVILVLLLAGNGWGQLIPFADSGHSLFLEETEKFNAALIKFAGK